MTLTLRPHRFLSALSLLSLCGCASQPAPTASTLTGSVAQASFASPVSKITITNDKGQSTTAALGAHGEFSIPLEKGATYRLFLSDDGKSMPVILNSSAADLVTTVRVKSGGASVDIGAVRFWPGDSPLRDAVTIDPAAVPVTPTASCVNGVLAGSTKPCASGTAAAQCTDEDGDGEHANGDHQDDHSDGEQADDSAETDQNDGEKADDAVPVVADPKQAVGIPERNLAGDLGCDEDGDGDGESID